MQRHYSSESRSWFERLRSNARGVHSDRWFDPVDIAGLAVFRIAFGFLMAVELYSYVARGIALRDFGYERARFSYWRLEWIQPLPGQASLYEFWILIALALDPALG